MKIQAKDTFFKSYKKMVNSECWWRWEFYKDKYYEFKWAIKSLIKYFRVVIQMRPWDSYSMMLMMRHQAKILLNTLEKYGNEIDETRLPKIKKLKRFVKLVNNYIEDRDGEKMYSERCGYDTNAEELKWIPMEENPDLFELISEKNPGYEHIDNSKAIKDGHKLEEKEWKEMMKILKDEMRSWWD